MFHKHCNKSFKRAKNSSVDNNWSFEPVFNRMLFPFKIFIIPFILCKEFTSNNDFMFIILFFVFFIISWFSRLLLSNWLIFLKTYIWTLLRPLIRIFTFRMVGLVLQVKSYWQLEINLNSSALMRSLHCIKHFDINLRSIESTIPWVIFPRFPKLV